MEGHTLTDFCFGYARGMSVENAFYELLQNTMDGVLQVNGDTFNTVRIEKTVLDGGGRLIEFMNGSTTLGHIVQTAESITFSNYDIVLDSIDPLTKIGCTTKADKPHYAGQHGEGFKRATLRLLQELCCVRVVCALRGKEAAARLVEMEFELNQERQCMSYSCRDAGQTSRPSLSVIVSWAKPEWRPPILLDEWIITASAVVRDPADENDAGTLLNGPAYNGKLYHWHLLVKHIPHMRFGYDCFIGSVPRDRHIVQVDQLLFYVAAILSRSILQEDNVGAELVFEEICCNDAPAKTLESNCLKLLSMPAKKKLLDMMKKKHPDKRFIRKRDVPSTSPEFKPKSWIVFPDHVVDCLEAVAGNINFFVEQHRQMLLKKQRVSASKEWQNIFGESCAVFFVEKSTRYINYAFDKTTTPPTLVFNTGEESLKRTGLSALTQSIIPNLCLKHGLVIEDFAQFMHRLLNYFAEGKDEPEAKRLKRDPPPAGYAYYEGPPLLVRVEEERQ